MLVVVVTFLAELQQFIVHYSLVRKIFIDGTGTSYLIPLFLGRAPLKKNRNEIGSPNSIDGRFAEDWDKRLS